MTTLTYEEWLWANWQVRKEDIPDFMQSYYWQIWFTDYAGEKAQAEENAKQGKQLYELDVFILDRYVSGINYFTADGRFTIYYGDIKEALLTVEVPEFPKPWEIFTKPLPPWLGGITVTLNGVSVEGAINSKLNVAPILVQGENYLKIEFWGIAFNAHIKAYIKITYYATKEQQEEIVKKIEDAKKAEINKITVTTTNPQGQTTTLDQTIQVLTQTLTLFVQILPFMLIIGMVMYVISYLPRPRGD